MKAQLEDTVAISRAIVHGYFSGDIEPYLSRLCGKSVWMGSGARTLIGDGAIRTRLESVICDRSLQIYQEEYFPLALTPRCQAVTAEVNVGPSGQTRGDTTVSYTFLYQLIGSETKLVLLHASYELIHSFASLRDDSGLEEPAYQLVRDILLENPPRGRLPIPSGNSTLFLHPDMIFYVRSKNRKTELFCVDKVIQSDLSISEINALLPETFSSIHRCYTVNTRYITAIRRHEVSLITGETLPIPFHAYMRVKVDLERRISGKGKLGDV